LNAQLLAQAVRQGRSILQEGSSLADELDHLTKEEVRDNDNLSTYSSFSGESQRVLSAITYRRR